MAKLKKIQVWVEAINTYYAFALLVYAAALYVAANSHIFIWVPILATPILCVWTGYLLHAAIERRYIRHGFRMISDNMTYEIHGDHTYTLRFTTTIQAQADHLMVYPIGYQWTGSGKESMPELATEGQHILAQVEHRDKDGGLKVGPYKAAISTYGDWHYWFVAFNPPVHRGDIVKIRYSQRFEDRQSNAKPMLYYVVRSPMKRLELSVKFPPTLLPAIVTGSYIKPTDINRPYTKKGVIYDPDKQWATWVIRHPKKGHFYRLLWH